MFKYYTEILDTSTKWISDKPNQADILAINELINKRSEEGWELVTYSYISSFFRLNASILITFKKS